MKTGSSNSIGFCVLGYRPQEDPLGQPSPSRILTFLVRTGQEQDSTSGDALEVLVAPEWHSFVDPQDHSYIASLLEDFKLRSLDDGEALMEQLSALSVGPILTHATGAKLADHADLYEISRMFIRI